MMVMNKCIRENFSILVYEGTKKLLNVSKTNFLKSII